MMTKQSIQNDITRFKMLITIYSDFIEENTEILKDNRKDMNTLHKHGYVMDASKMYTSIDILESKVQLIVDARITLAKVLRKLMMLYNTIPDVTNHDIAQLLGVNHIALDKYINAHPDLDKRIDVLAMCEAESLVNKNSGKPLYQAMIVAFEDACENLEGLKEYAYQLKDEQDAEDKHE